MDLTYSAKSALDTVMKNPARVWVGDREAYAKPRLTSGEFLPIRHTPKFTFSNDTKIFTIGSCFAREVEEVLLRMGIPLVAENEGVPPEHFESWDEAAGWGGGVQRGKLSRGALNKYNVHSMTHELRRVLRDEKFPFDGMFEIREDQWFDPHSSGLKLLPYETASRNRSRIGRAMATVKNADVMFITLGLTESWIDTETNMVMNSHPGGPALKRFDKRFQFIDFGYDAILNEILDLLSLIRETCNSNMLFVVTVSPVPLGATFRATDVIVANSASKCTLRAVAETVSRTFDYVDYFPSYELVTNSPRSIAWEEDQLHVARPMVQHIMNIFCNSYLRENEAVAA